MVVASEYAGLTARWIADRGYDARVLRSCGATEVLPPEDADCIVDNTATGSTLVANGLEIFDELMTSSTRLYASRAAMDDPSKRDRIEGLVMLVRSVLEARARVMVEVNVSTEALGAVVEALPCMREPTVSPLRSASGYAVKAAVERRVLSRVIPAVKAAGGTDIVVTTPEQIVP
jgi:ATP phosphoribosyltransferase-like protein